MALLGVDDVSIALADMLEAPWLPVAAAIFALGLFIGLGVLSFAVPRDAFERYRPAASEI